VGISEIQRHAIKLGVQVIRRLKYNKDDEFGGYVASIMRF